MKTIVLSVAMFLGTFVCVNACTNRESANTANVEAAVTAVQQDKYAEVKFESLSEKVQEAIKAYGPEYSVKSLAFNPEKKLTKATLVSKADNSEKVVILNEEGKEIK